MKRAYGNADSSCKSVQFLEGVRRQVEPATTVLRYFGVIDVYQVSPPEENVTRLLSVLVWPFGSRSIARISR